MNKLSWWKTSFGQNEIKRVANSINNKNLSQGIVTEKFEKELAKFINVKNVICVTSGSAALVISLLAANIKPGDEVLIPNYTWIATAHAVKLIGAKPILIDVEKNKPLIDVNLVEKNITKKTKAIIPVHLNGRSANMILLKKIAKKYNLFIIEDCAQALGSKNGNKHLGTQGDISIFSLSVAKIISTGQGGFVATNSSKLNKKIRLMRTHGVENITNPKSWPMLGFNFRYTDVLASIGIEQLNYIKKRIIFLRKIYTTYKKGLQNTKFTLIPVDINNGEVPVYNEFLINDRDKIVKESLAHNFELRPFFPEISLASYLLPHKKTYENSKLFSKKGIILPSGPSQKIEDIHRCISFLRKL